jgi:PAS domain-containing protein
MNRSSRYILILSQSPLRLLAIAGIFFFFGLLLDYNFVVLEIDPSREILPATTMRALLWAVLLLMTGVISLLFEAVLSVHPSGEQYNEQIKKRAHRKGGQKERSVLRSKQQAQLDEDLKHLKLVENFNLGVVVVDNKGEILGANPEFLNKTGYTVTDLIDNKATVALENGTAAGIVFGSDTLIDEKKTLENKDKNRIECIVL